MAEPNTVFDRDILPLKRRRALNGFENHDFLHDLSAAQLADRLKDIQREFPTALNIGTRTPNKYFKQWKEAAGIETLIHMDVLSGQNNTPYVQGDEEILPFGGERLSLILSNLNLHSVNDLPGALIQIRRGLKPDGLFLGAIFGGETLWQLRQSLNHAEQELYGGMSPRVFPFADKPQMGALLQRAGFALPVVDSELVTVTYPNVFKLMVELRGMGESNIIHARRRDVPKRQFFHKAGQYYADHFSDKDGKIEATFEIIYLIGWAPDDSQQKPMTPGSAEKSLAEALDTNEISTGETTGE